MINLLPPDRITMYRYARRNAQLGRWIGACGLALGGLAFISLAGMWYIQQQTHHYVSQSAVAEAALASQNQAATERQAKDISDSIKLAVQVLKKEILFSDLLRQMATITPDNVTLANLNINQLQGALDITANATTYQTASQLQVNMADPANKIFSQAEIINVTCASQADSATIAMARYPCTVTIRALFAPDNPFLFAADKKAAS